MDPARHHYHTRYKDMHGKKRWETHVGAEDSHIGHTTDLRGRPKQLAVRSKYVYKIL